MDRKRGSARTKCLSTLSAGESYVDHALRNSQHDSFTGSDRRGKHRPHNKTPEIAVERAKQHIMSFPVVESHYTRKDTRRQYLASNLNIQKMYELHKTQPQMDGVRCVTAKKYRSLFNENLSFHVPKKDQCLRCTVHSTKKKQGTLTQAEEESFQHHFKRRGRARDEKEQDKQKAKKDDSRHVITVDMQAVMQAPCGLVSQLYYKRKLSVYNFTTYSLSDGKGTCHTWDETEGKEVPVKLQLAYSCTSLHFLLLFMT